MGLTLRYLLERGFDIELDFTDALPIRIKDSEYDFSFSDLNRAKE